MGTQVLNITDKLKALCIRVSLLSNNIYILAPVFVPIFSVVTQLPQKQNLRLILGKIHVGPTNKPAGQFPEKEPGTKLVENIIEGSVSVPTILRTGGWFAAPRDRGAHSKGRRDEAALSLSSLTSQLGSTSLSLCFLF